MNATEQNGWTALMLASHNGQFSVVTLLLECEAEVNAVKQDGRTALMLAGQSGHCDVVRVLLEKGADVNTTAHYGATALLVASGKGHCGVVKLLPEREADVNATTKGGRTALILSSKNGHCDVTRLLLEREADVNAVDHNGWTALILASHNGHCDVVRLLLEKKADVNASDQNECTALILATQKGYWNTSKLLIDAGANVFSVNSENEKAIMYITFAQMSRACDIRLCRNTEIVRDATASQKSHYGISSASLAFIAALLYDTKCDMFDCLFVQSTLLSDALYAFLPSPLYGYCTWKGYLYSPYHGIEGKISLHTMGTAMMCKLPHSGLWWLTQQHQNKLFNMLGQTPLRLLAMENRIFDDMEEKILVITEKVCFGFSDRDNNGRVPYHIACMCLNAQFLLCGLSLDSDFRGNMLVQDHLGKTPLGYMSYLLFNKIDCSGVPLLTLLSARKALGLLDSTCIDLAMRRDEKANRSPRIYKKHCRYDWEFF